MPPRGDPREADDELATTEPRPRSLRAAMLGRKTSSGDPGNGAEPPSAAREWAAAPHDSRKLTVRQVVASRLPQVGEKVNRTGESAKGGGINRAARGRLLPDRTNGAPMRRAPPTRRESGRCGGPLFRFRVEPRRARDGARPATGPARARGCARDLVLGDPLSLLGGLARAPARSSAVSGRCRRSG